jgi:hypothetical protein
MTSQRWPIRAWMWAMSPTLQAPLTMTKEVCAPVDEHQVVDDAAFVVQQQAVALLAHLAGRSRPRASGSRTRRRRRHPTRRSWPMCDTSNRPAAVRVCWCSAIRPAGVLHRHGIAGKRHHAGAQLDMQRVQRGGEQFSVMGSADMQFSWGQTRNRGTHAMGCPAVRFT